MGYQVVICLAFLFSISNVHAAPFNEANPSSHAQANPPSQAQSKHRFVGLGGGILNYPTSTNAQKVNGAGGVNIGVALPYSFWIEGGFMYSYQQMADSVGDGLSGIDQFSLIAKPTYQWSLPDFWLTPIIGMAVSYTIRSYNSFSNKTNAFDFGPIAAIDIDLTEALVIGVEYRYMMNMGYSSDAETSNAPKLKTKVSTRNKALPPKEKVDLESLSYQVLMLNAKWKF